MSDPTDPSTRRSPGAFSVNTQKPVETPARAPRKPQSFDGPVEVTPDVEDPFLGIDTETPAVIRPARKRVSLGAIASTALGTLLSLAVGIWIDDLVRALFNRSTWLGYAALGVAAVFAAALAAIVIREVLGIWRIDSVQALKADAEAAIRERKPGPARAVLAKLTALLANRPETTRGRAALAATEGDVIDGPHLIALCETELLAPLDAQARNMVLDSAKRVSVVTAVSPRAVVDLAFVLFESVRLIRRVATLYGGRPGAIGMIRLVKDVLSHLAVTGTIAVGDSLVQQVLGHGVASRLSARLGEGVINGLMTARIGIAAMDYCRPLPFHARKRPGIGDFISDLTPSVTGTRNPG